MARPTDYTPETVERVLGYLNDVAAGSEAIPTVAGIANWLGVSRSTVYEWAKEHPEFSDILEHCLANQEIQLLSKGLKGEFNPTITKLMLSKHGYRESSDITTGGKELPQPIYPVNVPTDDGNKEG